MVSFALVYDLCVYLIIGSYYTRRPAGEGSDCIMGDCGRTRFQQSDLLERKEQEKDSCGEI